MMIMMIMIMLLSQDYERECQSRLCSITGRYGYI